MAPCSSNATIPTKLSVPAITAISMALLIPCYWHHRIQAGDLGSHVYNAWLAMLAEKGNLPGVTVVTQYQNVLFDLMVFYLGKLVGLSAAEKLAVSICVLILFWGVFFLVRTLTRRNPWPLASALGVMSYGYVFNMGFFNYYLSVGLASIALGLFLLGGLRCRISAIVLLPVIALAHPLGVLWFVGAAGYLELWNRIPKWRIALPALAILGVWTVRLFLIGHPTYQFEWRAHHFFFYNGADQLLTYGWVYRWLYAAAEFLAFLILAVDLSLTPNRRRWWKERALLIELYLVAMLVTAFLPDSFRTGPDAFWIGLIVQRLTLITAIFGLCLINMSEPRRWHAVAFGVLGLAYFGFLYRDTGLLDRMERNAEQLVVNLPPGTRVLKTVNAPDDWNVSFIYHSVERACVYKCISFSNYEAMTGQFRVRAAAGNRFVTWNVNQQDDMDSGKYEVQEEDLPLKQIYQCDPKDFTKLCIHDLAAGEINGRLGTFPGDDDEDEDQGQ